MIYDLSFYDILVFLLQVIELILKGIEEQLQLYANDL